MNESKKSVTYSSSSKRSEVLLTEAQITKLDSFVNKLTEDKKPKVKKEKTHKQICSQCGTSEKFKKVPI